MYRASLFASGLLIVSTAAFASDGTVDLTFGTSGLARAGISDATASTALTPVVQPDGKIVTCGTRTQDGTSGKDFFVSRSNADGSLDASFSFDGEVAIDFDAGTGADYCLAVAVQGDGKIVVAGYTYGADNNEDFAVARLNADGTLDTTGFGAGTGKVTIAFDLGNNNSDRASAIAIQSDGKIVLAGTVQTANNGSDFGIVRLETDGTRDGSFNLTGKATVGFDLPNSNKNDVAAAVAIDSSGNIVVAGTANKDFTFFGNDFAVARLLPNGQLDPNFDADGRATVAFDLGGAAGSNDDVMSGMTLSKDGDIVLVGSSDSSSNSTANYDVSVARLRPDGSLSATFGLGGKVVVPFDLASDGQDAALCVVEQTNGKLVVVGYAESAAAPFTAEAIALRLNQNGSLDGQFGNLGKEAYNLGGTQLFTGVALQANQIIVSGEVSASPSSSSVDFFLARLDVDLIFADQF